jgi:hypothetical protein
MSLLTTYDNMLKKEAEDQVKGERLEVLNKFASLAAEQLEARYPGNWTKEEQFKLASTLIELAVEQEEAEVTKQEKVAELCESAKIFANEVWSQLEALAAQKNS